MFNKMQKTYLTFILVFYFTSIQCKSKRQIDFPIEESEECITPDGKTGICELLVRCDQLLSSRNIKILRQSICGYDDEVPKVCCPLTMKTIQSTTTKVIVKTTAKPVTKRPKRPKAIRTSSRPTNDRPNKSNPNLKPSKLPEFCGNTSVIGKTRIVGGKVSDPGSWPWMAAVFIEDSDNLGSFSAQCGGTLISSDSIITASHCVVEGGRALAPNRIKIRLGEHNIYRKTKDDAEVDYNVIKVTAHPDFEPQTYKNDVAILLLAQKVRFNRRVWPICLPYDTRVLTSEDNIGRSGHIIGWGKVEFNGRASEELREADVTIMSSKECGKAFDRIVTITDEYLCAGTVGSTRDSCQGDSGGPLIQIDPQNRRYYLTGIVSFGKRCATPGFPGVYAKVSHFLHWIANNI